MSSSPPPPQPPPPPSPPHVSVPPLGIPLLLPPPPEQPQQQPHPSSSRRLPPPCWTPDEISALIDAYREKWYSVRLSNLRAAHWQDVADGVHRVCPAVSLPKTAVQCRHKMEKLRKRYRVELQRAKSIPHHRFSSSWIYFLKMDSMEKGIDHNNNNNVNNNVVASISPVNVVVNDDLVNINGGFDVNFDNYNVNYADDVVVDEDYDNRTSIRKDFQRNGLKIRIAGNSLKNYGGFDQISNPNPRFGRYNEFATSTSTPPQFEEGVRFASRVLKNGGEVGGVGSGGSSGGGSSSGMGMNVMTKKERIALGKRVRGKEKGKGRDGMAAMEMVEAIRVMGEGFMRMEKMKMDMVRESERERMECELKCTQMILESQRQIVEAFSKGWSEVVNNEEIEDDEDRGNDEDGDAKNNSKDES